MNNCCRGRSLAAYNFQPHQTTLWRAVLEVPDLEHRIPQLGHRPVDVYLPRPRQQATNALLLCPTAGALPAKCLGASSLLVEPREPR